MDKVEYSKEQGMWVKKKSLVIPNTLYFAVAVVMFDFVDLKRRECKLQKNPTQKDFFQ
jgi:hypothetical protein